MKRPPPPPGRGRRQRKRSSIRTKIVGINLILLLVSIVTLVWIANEMFTKDNTALVQQVNYDTATSLSQQVRATLENTIEKTSILGRLMIENPAQIETLSAPFFVKDENFLGMFVLQKGEDSGFLVSQKAFASGVQLPSDWEALKQIEIAKTQSTGALQVEPVSLPDGTRVLALVLPLVKQENGEFRYVLLSLLRQEPFVEMLSQFTSVSAYLVDAAGRVLIHVDGQKSFAREDVSQLGIVAKFLEGKTTSGQTKFLEPISRTMMLGAFRSTGFAGIGVIAEVPEQRALEAAERVRVRSMWVAFSILCLSFLVGYLYSGSLTWPIKQIFQAAYKISEGDFNIQLNPKTNDEIAGLSLMFNRMAKDLAHRMKVIETFNKFHNKEVADLLLSGAVKLGGERKVATIFFSDIRGFTSTSERMEPEAVVEMLNEYMTRMVAVILRNGGIVDKFIGDAIMATWGVPVGRPDDCANAVRACLEMREELRELNRVRVASGKMPIQMGMGLNQGEVIAGNIGSNEKMEYTVIGDCVNTANRIESLTKELKTDFLVSESVYETLKHQFIFEAPLAMEVKGKAQAIKVYQVVGPA